MSFRCKAVVLRKTDAPRPFAQSMPLSVEEVELLPPGPNEVVVKIAGAGLCHSDLSVLNGDRPRPVPMVLGHEGSGEIVEVGSAVNDINVGDHVVFQFSASCGRCRRCLKAVPKFVKPRQQQRVPAILCLAIVASEMLTANVCLTIRAFHAWQNMQSQIEVVSLL